MLFPAVRHELSFWHGARRHAGDLVLPDTAGPHPVVLVVGEPGATQRDRSAWLDGLAASGIACFTWDRVTVADDARDATSRISDHAREVLAALDRLRYLPEVDGDAVALLGWGEGGWVAAQAATFSGRVRALVLAGTPTAPPAPTAPLVAPVAQIEHELFASPLADTRRDVNAALTAGLVPDPLPTLSAVRVPVLALFGEQDPLIPLEESVRGVHEALGQAGHTDHRVAVVRGADHGLCVRPRHGRGGMIDGRYQFGEWPVGLTQVLVEWLDERIRPLDGVPAYAPPETDVVTSADGVEPTRPGPATPTHDHSAHPALGPSPARCDARDGGTHLPVRQVRRRITH